MYSRLKYEEEGIPYANVCVKERERGGGRETNLSLSVVW